MLTQRSCDNFRQQFFVPNDSEHLPLILDPLDIVDYHQNSSKEMAATAKRDLRRKFSAETSGEEDIAAIAKQISDHAEAIYQTWKSRGLAPTEILNCHNNASAADKFGSALSPISSAGKLNIDDSSPELDNNNLEKLVNNFVEEDKARVAARQRSPGKNLPSSIQFALQKFERNSVQSQVKSLNTENLHKSKGIIQTAKHNLSNNGKDIERPNNLLLDGSDSSSLNTWPLKNKIFNDMKTKARQKPKYGNAKESIYLKEVAREEKRLIDALKTGTLISDDTRDETDSIVYQDTHHTFPIEAKSLNREDLSTMSLVDYAKVRYSAAQNLIQPKPKQEVNPVEQHVSITRSKFEPETQKSPKLEETKEERDLVHTRWGAKINATRPRLEQVPHPELTVQQKQHIRSTGSVGSGNNPVRPFLTRGSVAERVLIFEKCPSELLLDKRGPRQSVVSTTRVNHDVNNKTQSYVREKQKKNLPPHTTLQRHVKANKNVDIPRFYFPEGKPVALSQVEATVARIAAAFQVLPGQRASRSQFHIIAKACDLPLYWKVPLFLAARGDQTGFVEMNAFLEFWKELTNKHHDTASRFVRITTKGLRDSILPEDLIPLVQDVVETHPGLTFLKEAIEFHSRYVHTVIARIFYCVNRSWSGKISVAELRRSNLLSVISVLEHGEDINLVTAYFSYEHFYVIYCKFWELDRDHDLFIDKMDLMRHNDHALSTRMIERIFSGAVTRGNGKNSTEIRQGEGKMSYTEFVWFLLSEEDKNHPTAIEYWFRCMDLDGDGYLSMYELEYFYEEQLLRMEAIGIETLPFEDCLCQMLDMIHPKIPDKISLADLKTCKMTTIFFDTFFNLEKYLDHEQRDPFASAREHDADGHELSDWDRFAAEEYELLVAEENGNDQTEQMQQEAVTDDDYASSQDLNLESNSQNDGNSGGPRGSSETSGSKSHQPKAAYCDSCDSDDYADSDN